MKTHFLIEILEWAEKRQNGFTQEELMSARSFKSWEAEIIRGYFANANSNHIRKGLPNFVYLPETIFYVIRTDPKPTFVLTPDAFFKHIDYTELRLARQTAREAKVFSERSIKVSDKSVRIAILAVGVSVIAPLLTALLVTQTVKLEEKQIIHMESVFQAFEMKASSSTSRSI